MVIKYLQAQFSILSQFDIAFQLSILNVTLETTLKTNLVKMMRYFDAKTIMSSFT
jgi:hypothetical protein